MVCPQVILVPLPRRKWGAARSGGQRLLSPASDGGKKGQEPFLDQAVKDDGKGRRIEKLVGHSGSAKVPVAGVLGKERLTLEAATRNNGERMGTG